MGYSVETSHANEARSAAKSQTAFGDVSLYLNTPPSTSSRRGGGMFSDSNTLVIVGVLAAGAALVAFARR